MNTFCIPKTLWSPAIRNSNGYFGCEATYDTNSVAGFSEFIYSIIQRRPSNQSDLLNQHETNKTQIHGPTSK